MSAVQRVIPILMLCLIASSAFAIALEPGVYKLEPKRIKTTPSLIVMAGTVKTDSGEIAVAIRDSNFNGSYSDKIEDRGSYLETTRSADTVCLGETYPPTYTMRLGRGAMLDGKLYALDVSASGDTLTISRYTGETGVVKIEAKNGDSKAVPVEKVILYGANGLYASEIGHDTVTIPVGDYTCAVAVLCPSGRAQSSRTKQPTSRSIMVQHDFVFDYYASIPIKVHKGTSSILRLGGKLGLEFTARFRGGLKLKRGQGINIEIFLTLNGSRVHRVSALPMRLDLFDQSEKLLSTFEHPFGHIGNGMMPDSFIQVLKVPQDWQPGDYKLRATADTGNYQGILTADAILTID